MAGTTSPSNGNGRKPRPAPPPKILLVDDSKSVLRAMDALLTEQGFNLDTAADGTKALKKIESNTYDLVITDLDMPSMDGFELCRNIKNTPETKSTPVIILSVRQDKKSVEKGFESGASAYVSKREAVSELVPRIHELLEKNLFARRFNILAVDDSISILHVVRNGLEQAGFRTSAAPDGRQALEMLKSGLHVDLVLTDLDMPVMSGRELCRALHADPRYSKIPVVVMSGTSSRSAMLDMIHEGAASYIAKPFRVEQLCILLERLLSDQFRLMLEEKKRIESERTLIFGAISSLINALEARDAYTKGHSDSVAHLSVNIGRILGLDDNDLSKLELAGHLHDLGKIGIRDNVLLKPGKLTEEEYLHIQSHTVIVEDILKPITSLREVRQVATTHHERWDGSGYPNGIKGEDIPLMGRITAVADVYDALTSDRPYRKALSENKALSIIRDMRGTHLCPTCVYAFLKWRKTLGIESRIV